MLLTMKNQLVLLLKKYLNTKLKRYIFVGGFAYFVEMLTILVGKNVLGFKNVLAVAVSYWVGLAVAFILQKIITFSNLDKRIHIVGKQLSMYAILILFNYFLTLIAVSIFSKYISVYIIRTIVILFLTLINFNVYKIIFKATN